MSIIPPQAVEVSKRAISLRSDTSCPGERDLLLATRSAAYAAECPIAVFYVHCARGFEFGSAVGTGSHLVTPALGRLFGQVAHLGPSDLLVLNDLNYQLGFLPGDAHLFGDDMRSVRFVAAARVVDDQGVTLGVLVVADEAAHAGLSAAKTYVLRAHAAQIASLLELKKLREVSGQAGSKPARQSDTERLRLLESVVVNANDAVLITEAEPIDLPGPRIVYCNAAFTKTTGYTEAEILGRTPRLLQSKDVDRKALDKLRLALTRWEPVEVELLNCRKDGTEFWVELSIVPVANEKGWFTHWVSVQRDVSDRKASEETATRARIAEAENIVLEAEIQERKRIEAQLLYSAFHDDLTKLRNRTFFMDRLKAVIDRTQRDPGFHCAVLFMDLDRFKLVNDSLGHRAGDLLLMEVAQRLRSCIRPQDTLARVGGDEFALLVEGMHGMDAAIALAQRIIEAMRRPLWIGKQEVFSSCSVGLVRATQHHQQPEELLRDADIAMYEAKRNDTGGYAIFAGSMHESAVEMLELRTDLRNAVARSGFFLEYQPVCSSSTGQITGLEALIRWRHPVRGLIPPLAFIATAEETGLIREIGRWVLREASTQMCRWRDRFPGLDLKLNVNTSGEELKDRRFTSGVRDTLSATGLDPRALQLEVTESIFLQDPELIGTILNGIRALGVRIALDDFGMGYSSLSYLDRYQMDTLKIDRSFVASMLTRQRTMAIVETVVKLGRALDMDIVAEGVEYEDQLQALQAGGCHLVQGYYLGRPLSVDDVDVALSRHSGGGQAIELNRAGFAGSSNS